MYDVTEERDEETIKHARDRTWLYSQAIAIFHVVQIWEWINTKELEVNYKKTV